jgi:hypothetical protein
MITTMKPMTVIDYIVKRLTDEGITHCFGVPGDYAFPVCDAVDRNPNSRGVGCSRELNVVQEQALTTEKLAIDQVSSDYDHGTDLHQRTGPNPAPRYSGTAGLAE